MNGTDSDNPKAFKALSEALKGEVNSQYQLAMILEEEKDIDLACAWYQKAAQQGHSSAAFRCGMLCLKAKGLREREAVYWLQQAANAGHTGAQYNLALVHENGLGVSVDPEEALKWHRVAARRGHPDSQAKLDSMSNWLGVS